ncbi:MAG: TolC family protein [Muribaculaceae bacterium]|nr:TolC family protein [Muribaculaceae bacterium]
MKRLFPFFAFILLLATKQGIKAEEFYFPTEFGIEQVTEASPMAMPEVWSFNDCINWAIANNIDIRQSMLSILQAEENIGQAKDSYLPYVGFSTNQSFSNYPSPQENQNANSYNSSYNINANWTVWEGNARKYRVESAKLVKLQQQLYGDDVVKNLQIGILQAYLNILYSAEAVDIARKSLEVSTAQANRTKRLMETGRTSKVDYAQIESQKAQDEYNLVQAKSSYASSKVALKNLLNLGLDYDLNIEEVNFSDSLVNNPLPTKTQVFEIAMNWLPQFKSNELNKSIYDYNIKIAKSTYYPSISLTGGLGTGYNSGNTWGWGTQMKNFFNENIGLSLSVPIYDGNATRRAINIAKLQALEYDLTKTQLKNDLSQTIENLYIELDNSRAKYLSGLSQLEATSLSAELVDRQFELGLVNPLELLTAHNNLLNARLELLQSKFMAILSSKTIEYYATSKVSIP